MKYRRLGRSGTQVSEVILGSWLTFGSSVDEKATAACVKAALDVGIQTFDTADVYALGAAERALGKALAGVPRKDVVLATKCFWPTGPGPNDKGLSRKHIVESCHASLERLGTDRIDVALVHDPDDHEDLALRLAFPTLVKLRDEGVVAAVGCGMNQSAMLERFVASVDLDCVLLAGRYSLLDRGGADELLPRCLDRGVGVILGGVFNSGVLADPEARPTYDYAAAPDAVVDRARALRAVCDRHGVALPAAALRFAMRHEAVTTVVVGARSAAEIVADVAFASAPIAESLWSDLAALD